MTRLRRFGQALLNTGDTPERTALAFALGVLIGYSPLLGAQTPIALGIAFAFRLNRLAVLGGVYSNLPWVMPIYYAGTTAGGAWLLGQSVPPDFAPRLDALMGLPGWRAQLDALFTLVRPFFAAYALGSALGCTLLASAAYPAALAFVRRRRLKSDDSPDFRLPG